MIVEKEKRHKIIVKTGVVGLLTNLILAAAKAFVGIMSHSIAIVVDAANSLSDCLSSIATIIVSHLANKAPDKKHPLGHGRSEYMGTLIVGAIIGYIGLTAGFEAIKKIFNPSELDYTPATTIVVSIAVVTKVILSAYTLAMGKKADSDTLRATAKDAFFDALISSSMLIAIATYTFAHINIEPYLAIVICIFILRSSLEILRGAASILLGERTDKALGRRVRNTISKIEGVEGAYDLLLHDYGPSMTVASVNIEVASTMTAPQIDSLTRKIRKTIYKRYQIALAAVGVYSINTKDEETRSLYHKLQDMLEDYPEVIELHGFHVDKEEKIISFDIIIDFAIKKRDEYFEKVKKASKNLFPEYSLEITLDSDLLD